MAHNPETGHAKNVANLKKLIDYADGYGSKYVPSDTAISIASLNLLHAKSESAMADVTNAQVAFNRETNTRYTTFAPIKKLTTRIIRSLKGTQAAESTIEDAIAYQRKIRGTRATPKPKKPKSNPDGTTPDDLSAPDDHTISVSQQSYDNLVDHFRNLYATLKAEPLYVPNETDLNIAALLILLDQLHQANQAVVPKAAALSNARINRNTVLYKEKVGLFDIAAQTKNYISSVFGTDSPQYKEVCRLAFKK